MSHHSSAIYQQHDSFIGKLAQQVHNVSSQILLAVMTVVITLEVMFRYCLGAGFTWSQEICGLAFLLMVFLCQANTWQEDRHIRMDIFYNMFSRRFKAFSDVLSVICGFILYCAIAYQGFFDLQYQFDVDEATIELMWPLWPFTLMIIVSSAIAILLLARYSLIVIYSKLR